MHRISTSFLAIVALCFPAAAQATDDDFELWVNPSISFDLDEDTGMEIETAQRFRDGGNGREDTYFARLWLNQQLNDTVTIAGAFERRINDGGANETRLIQQMSTRHGILRTRLRLEQRFVDDADRMGLRVRPRVGVAIPLDEAERWTFDADAELFVTLRSNNVGGDDGLTGMRTQIGLSYELNERLSLSAAYLRDQDFEDGRPDTVGHAPIIGVEYSF
ncbi:MULTISPECIES: DUF2490 domain-containing protein [unclassified Erythrobacter]|uniref:DUF2490 domain-containing protein n=1 Tax=unclassified Erythrobacter TaxID=2633097 RepID=UPI00076BE1A5|nr:MULTISPECIES: DUF2490 domain-containing protein [unclassified Erythrobacter]KWV92476.1 hypothetical protein ASS64_14590 [Erythrobacter sp. AP23]MBO6766768.1 DUF2490 domain-containing protein [Erythrobacter sp.]